MAWPSTGICAVTADWTRLFSRRSRNPSGRVISSHESSSLGNRSPLPGPGWTPMMWAHSDIRHRDRGNEEVRQFNRLPCGAFAEQKRAAAGALDEHQLEGSGLAPGV